MKHIVHPEADAEFAEAISYYSAIAPELGVRFYREIERLIRILCAEPRRFFLFHPPARRSLAREFPYSVVYLERSDHILIVAVMHAKRKPGYWKQRVG